MLCLRQFDSGPRDDFRLRMSNIGKPRCQLWYEKNDPKGKTPFPPHFLMNMILGDIVEAVFKGIHDEQQTLTLVKTMIMLLLSYLMVKRLKVSMIWS